VIFAAEEKAKAGVIANANPSSQSNWRPVSSTKNIFQARGAHHHACFSLFVEVSVCLFEAGKKKRYLNGGWSRVRGYYLLASLLSLHHEQKAQFWQRSE